MQRGLELRFRDRIRRYVEKNHRQENTRSREAEQRRSIGAARFYESEEIGLERPEAHRFDRVTGSISRIIVDPFLPPSPSLSPCPFFTPHGLGKLDISTSTLTRLKETLSLTYLEKRFADESSSI